MALKKKEVKPAENNVLDEEKYIDDLVSKVSAAQKIFATYSQEQVDEIFKRVALKMSSLRIPLAQMAAEESRMGVMEDKVIKNHFAAEYIYNKYKKHMDDVELKLYDGCRHELHSEINAQEVFEDIYNWIVERVG